LGNTTKEDLMFVQLITGRTHDAEGFRRRGKQWAAELRPGTEGFLGSTAGVADDGTFAVLARFADERAAQANSNRPEQSAWWAETVKLLDGEPTFRESSDVRELFGGGSDDATFVQVISGTVVDRARVDEFETDEMLEQLRAARPDLLGGITAFFPDGTYAEVAYFTDEDAARSGESSEDFAGPAQEYAALFTDLSFVDLRDPQLVGPA
jgi:hypothetical protein